MNPQMIDVLKRLKEAGYPSYFVGGTVRDFLLGNHTFDIDVATTALPEDVVSLFSIQVSSSDQFALRFGTVRTTMKGLHLEITTFRGESDYDDFRHPKTIYFTKEMSIDAKRRDFTINALYMDEEGKIYDLVGGLDDLHNQTIRTIGDPIRRFQEDPVRILRALRFMDVLNFVIDKDTELAIKQTSSLVESISHYRLQQEWNKWRKHRGVYEIQEVLRSYQIPWEGEDE